jgi:large subunit ribosomal protein L6
VKKNLREIIAIQDGVTVEISGKNIKLSKSGKTIEKNLPVNVKKQESNLVIEKDKATKKDKKLIKTAKSHLIKALSGLDNKYVYKMQVCAVHFPITAEVKGKEVIIKNFLGEVKDRKAAILPGTDVKIQKDIITIESHDKDAAGQTAANIENASRIVKRDRRVFQDGVFIIEKQKGARK